MAAEARTPSQHARRSRIIEVAAHLLDEREYEQIQIREVAEQADSALATVYRYFPSKELLYAYALISWGDTFEARVRGQNKTLSTDAERLRLVLRRTARAYGAHPNFYKLTMLLEVTTDTAARAVFAGYSERYDRIIRDLLRDVGPREREAIALLGTSLLGGLLRKWSSGAMPLRRVLDHIDDAIAVIFDENPAPPPAAAT